MSACWNVQNACSEYQPGFLTTEKRVQKLAMPLPLSGSSVHLCLRLTATHLTTLHTIHSSSNMQWQDIYTSPEVLPGFDTCFLTAQMPGLGSPV